MHLLSFWSMNERKRWLQPPRPVVIHSVTSQTVKLFPDTRVSFSLQVTHTELVTNAVEINFKFRFREEAAVCSNFLARSYSVFVVANNSIIFGLLIQLAGDRNASLCEL